MIEVTKELYTAGIPACCKHQTLRSHMDSLMLCWGLLAALEKGQKMDCSGCNLKVRPAGLAR